jgi:hypothetical protein
MAKITLEAARGGRPARRDPHPYTRRQLQFSPVSSGGRAECGYACRREDYLTVTFTVREVIGSYAASPRKYAVTSVIMTSSLLKALRHPAH